MTKPRTKALQAASTIVTFLHGKEVSRCFNCKQLATQHTAGGMCLFAPTLYRQMTEDELTEYIDDAIEQAAQRAAKELR